MAEPKEKKKGINPTTLIVVSMVLGAAAGFIVGAPMEPKVRAAIRFCEGRPDRTAVIGSLERAPEAVRGTSGTRIHY